MRFCVIGCLLWCAACTASAARSPSTQPLPPAAVHLAGQLSPLEEQHLAVVRGIHEGRGIIQRARESGILADSVEWWVAGPPDELPFAGTWRGIAGIAEFERRLNATMRYDRVELRRYLVSGDDVAVVFLGAGVARATGRPFESEIVRLYTFREGRVVRVRNYYDTAAYVAAVRGQPADSLAVRAHVARAVAFAAARRPRDAALAYREALALDPDYPGAANAALGQFWRAGFYDEAYRWAQRQAEREPTNLAVLFNYNVAAAFLIEPARAESLMLRALEIDPLFATAHGELAFLALYAGRMDDAVRHMEAAFAIDTMSALNRGGLAQMLVAAGQARRARTAGADCLARLHRDGIRRSLGGGDLWLGPERIRRLTGRSTGI
jgi:ketosteroid isomerase-like protein